MKRYGVSSPILGKIDFDNLYNIYSIDLSNKNPNYLNKNASVSIQLNKTKNFTPLMYVLTKVEKHLIIDPSKSTGDGSKSTMLSLVANSKQTIKKFMLKIRLYRQKLKSNQIRKIDSFKSRLIKN